MKNLLIIIVFLLTSSQVISQVKSGDKSSGKEVPANMLGSAFLQGSFGVTGAPVQVGKAYGIDNGVWVENIDDLIGRIVKVTTDSSGNETLEIFDRIVYDSIIVKLNPPKNPDINEEIIEKGSGGSISFMGIDLGGSVNSLYTFKATTLGFSRITSSEIDKKSIPTRFLCEGNQNCDFFYINAGIIRTCETIRLEEKKGSIKLKNVPLPSELVQINGEFYSGNKNSQRTVKNIIFATILPLPRN